MFLKENHGTWTKFGNVSSKILIGQGLSERSISQGPSHRSILLRIFYQGWFAQDPHSKSILWNFVILVDLVSVSSERSMRSGSILRDNLIKAQCIGRFDKWPSQRSIRSGSVLKVSLVKANHMGQFGQGPV